jgi:isopenicillin-N N-acyltransferase-like protein
MAIPFTHIQAKGSYRELGRAVGEGAREQCLAAIAFYEEHFVAMAGIDFAEAERQALGYLPYAQKYLPQYVEELEGMAEGCGLPFVKLLVPNCAEEFTCPTDADSGTSPHGGQAGDSCRPEAPGPVAGHFCTGVAVMTADRHLVAHDMDWYVVDADKNVLFDLTTPDGTRIVTIAGVPYLPILGMNSHGLAYVGNSVYSNDNRMGVPNVFVRRWALEAPTIEEAAARACMPMRARGSNHTFGDRAGRIWDVETSAYGAALIEAEGHYAHTNHYAAPAMAIYEGYHKEESRRRLQWAQDELAAGLARGDEPEGLVERVLRSHEYAPESICGHPDPADDPADQIMTVASMICDLDAMELKACAGPPCENPYQTFAAGPE